MGVGAEKKAAALADGTDTLLMAAEHALRRELSRRIRDDLISLGIVADGQRSASPTPPGPVRAT